MALKKLAQLICFVSLPFLSAFAQQKPLDPDSVINQVFKALTADEVYVDKDINKNLYNHDWEALAYWDTQEPKEVDYMQEAVGDIYKFTPSTFSIKAVDPKNPSGYLQPLTGNCTLANNTLTLTSKNGNILALNLILLDAHYLILEMDGLRIFFTKQRSFNAH